MLLVPDGQDMTDPRIAAWKDAASEEGVRLEPLTDSQFVQMGASARGFAGLVLPDDLHTRATDAVLAAVRDYTNKGGRTMLVYDFGALAPSGANWVYPTAGSRLSDLAGVNYVLYDQTLDTTTSPPTSKMVGLGPVTALQSTMRELQVPPGKSMPCPSALCAIAAPVSLAPQSATTASGMLKAAGVSSQSALFLPVSQGDPGGARGFDPQQYASLSYAGAERQPKVDGRVTPRVVYVDFGRAFKSAPVAGVTPTKLSPTALEQMQALITGTTADPLHAYTGYLLGALTYPTFVTQGTYAGKALAESPQFGLVSGLNTVGQGQVLFVNMPLTYLKGRTDALPMHGFLKYFTRNVLSMAHLSAMPNGVGGMTFDWHLDDPKPQLNPPATLQLESMGVFSDPLALFSMEMTAGPDMVNIGDKLGWNLASSTVAQGFLKRMDQFGHAVGSHGGWIHDYWGSHASETNQGTTSGGACVNGSVDNYQQCLVLNRRVVDGVLGHASRNYSAPEGNNPTWAMTWLEQQGVVAAYFVGHTGVGVTRHYRDGQLLNPNLWVSPVTPQGLYATFEEWQDFNVPKADVTQWYRDLINFGVSQNTSRMVYAHPPGAFQWKDVLSTMLADAKSQRDSGKFAWYTTTRLADFMATRLKASWTQAYNATSGVTTFNVSHPSGLNEMVWRLPKAKYPDQPAIVSGAATVASDDTAGYWLVKAGAGTSLSFTARWVP